MCPSKCPICLSEAHSKSLNLSMDLLECPRCGRYEISPFAKAQIANHGFSPLQIANISGWIRENSLRILGKEEIEYLISISDKTPTVGQKAEKLLLYLSKKYPVPSHWIEILKGTPEFLGVSWAQNMNEVRYLIEDYLVVCKHFLRKYPSPTIKQYTITPEGWAYIENLRYINPESQIGFVAMWLDPSLDFLFKEVIEPAIEKAGYEPKRIDRHEHINRIDAEIIAMIRKSKFVVADFTEQRGGVYFESGFAGGLGLPVFWLCEKEEVDNGKVHFDIRQYKFILWEKDKLSEAKDALQFTIESILGRGRYVNHEPPK
jgi:hypothetical protein